MKMSFPMCFSDVYKKTLSFIGFVLFVCCSYQSVLSQTIPTWLPTSGLLAWYPFSGDVIDMSGHGRHATNYVASLTDNRHGDASSAYRFNGYSFIELPINFDYPQRSVSLWLKLEDLFTDYQHLLDTDHQFLSYGFSKVIIMPNSTNLGVSMGQVNPGCTELIQKDEWYHLVMIRAPGHSSFFLNGSLMCRIPNSNVHSTFYSVPQISRLGTSYIHDRSFIGVMDEVAFWNRALTECEAQEIYTQEKHIITSQPESLHTLEGTTAEFSVSHSHPAATFQWQTNSGTGFHNLSDEGQYSGVTRSTLTVSNTTMNNQNQLFRCVISYGICDENSGAAMLTIEEKPPLPLLIHPNPFRRELFVQIPFTMLDASYSISDILGRIVMKGFLTEEITRLDTSSFTSGVYVLHLQKEEEYTFKLLRF